MTKALVAIVFSLALSFSAYAQTGAKFDDSIAGTHAVIFQPVQVSGTVEGCTLVYRAVQFDSVYLNGSPVVAVGNIGVQQRGGNMIVTFKIGVKNLAGNAPFVRPNFAYLQTKSGSTAKVKQQSRDGDDGFKLYVYSFFDPTVQKIFDEMMSAEKITIGFNRTPKGMDVLVPIDLDVIDATYPGGTKVSRVRTKETMNDFMGCFLTLLDQAKTGLEKK